MIETALVVLLGVAGVTIIGLWGVVAAQRTYIVELVAELKDWRAGK
jgi:hypothetical protein